MLHPNTGKVLTWRSKCCCKPSVHSLHQLCVEFFLSSHHTAKCNLQCKITAISVGKDNLCKILHIQLTRQNILSCVSATVQEELYQYIALLSSEVENNLQLQLRQISILSFLPLVHAFLPDPSFQLCLEERASPISSRVTLRVFFKERVVFMSLKISISSLSWLRWIQEPIPLAAQLSFSITSFSFFTTSSIFLHKTSELSDLVKYWNIQTFLKRFQVKRLQNKQIISFVVRITLQHVQNALRFSLSHRIFERVQKSISAHIEVLLSQGL